MRCRPKRRRTGFLIAAEAVEEDSLGPVEHGQADSFASPGCVRSARLDQGHRLGLAAAECEHAHCAVRRQVAACRLGRRTDLLDERLGGSQLAGEEVRVDALIQRERQLAERSGLAGDLHVSLGDRRPEFVFP
jgi:hypothetical protein